MELPELELYTEVDSNTFLPPLTDDHIAEFLKRFSKKGDVGKRMYNARFLQSCQAAYVGVDVYLRGVCNQFTVHVKIGEDGDVDETSCECCPEEDGFAKCNHVILMLFAAEEIVQTGTVKLHRPKKKLEKNPKKSVNSHPSVMKTVTETDSTEVDHNPVPRRYRNLPNYEDYVRKLCLAFGPSTMPIKQMYPRTEVENLDWDHCYGRIDDDL